MPVDAESLEPRSGSRRRHLRAIVQEHQLPLRQPAAVNPAQQPRLQRVALVRTWRLVVLGGGDE